MQLTTILYLKIPVYDDILQTYRVFGPILNLARQKVSIQEYIFFSILKRQNILIKLFTSTVCIKLTAFDLQDFKNGRFQRAVVYRVFICPKIYSRQLKACLLKSQQVET
jgi:hypothetical protein